MNNIKIGFGAEKSKVDTRDIKDEEVTLATPLEDSYITDLSGIDVFYQGNIGICTGAALAVGIIEYLYFKKNGYYTKLSVAFLYIVTKLYVDKNYNEGSSLRSALKAAYKYGVCSEVVFPTDVTMSHSMFLSQSISKVAWDDALNYMIGGYVSIPVDHSLMALAIKKYGAIYSRMEVGLEWYTPSWLESDIAPIQPPKKVISGHAIAITGFDFKLTKRFFFRNSWSDRWCRKGDGYFDFINYQPTENWAVTLGSVQHFAPSPVISQSVLKSFLDILRSIGLLK